MAVARFDTIRSKAAASITGSYSAVGTPLAQNWREFRLVNNTDGDLMFSANGTTDNFFLPAHTYLLWDLSTNAPPINETDTFVLAINTQFYVKTVTSATTGSVYIEGIYARRS